MHYYALYTETQLPAHFDLPNIDRLSAVHRVNPHLIFFESIHDLSMVSHAVRLKQAELCPLLLVLLDSKCYGFCGNEASKLWLQERVPHTSKQS